MTPTWYDLLGVEPDASDDQIRAAWKAGIADLEPGDRRFRTLNEAAELLLDPDRRAAYDATLAPEEERTPVDVPPPFEAVDLEKPEPDSQTDGSGETEAQPQPASETHEEPAAPQPTSETDPESAGPPRRTIPAWLLAVLAVLTVLMVVAAAYLATQPSDDAIADSTSDAQGSAERAASTILAYDWQTMDADQKAADALLTPSYRKKYDQLFAVLQQNQPTTKTVVTVDKIVASGVVRSGEDRVQVLVFVNRSRTNASSTEPLPYKDSVVMTMEQDDGEWLVDCMNTNPLGDQAATSDPC